MTPDELRTRIDDLLPFKNDPEAWHSSADDLLVELARHFADSDSLRRSESRHLILSFLDAYTKAIRWYA